MAQNKVRLVAFAGSLRNSSFNKVLLRVVVAGARSSGAEVEVVDLKELNLPMMNEDLEKAPLPAPVLLFREKIRTADGVLIASPEYNGSLSAPLKNAIDWASRPPNCWDGKIVGSCGSTPSWAGTISAQQELRKVLSRLNVNVLPEQVTVSTVHKQIDEKGELNNADTVGRLTTLGVSLVDAVRRKHAADALCLKEKTETK